MSVCTINSVRGLGWCWEFEGEDTNDLPVRVCFSFRCTSECELGPRTDIECAAVRNKRDGSYKTYICERGLLSEYMHVVLKPLAIETL